MDAISHNPSVALEYTASAFDFLQFGVFCLLYACPNFTV